MKLSPWLISLLLPALLLAQNAQAEATRPNVLFIAVDDLRPQLGCYGERGMHSPNIDRLAAQGVVFERAYCMVPTCGASRASLMTGIRPARKRFVSYQTWAERDAPGIVTLNTQFKRNGYVTLSNGKVFSQSRRQCRGLVETGLAALRSFHLPTTRKPGTACQAVEGTGPTRTRTRL